MPDDSPFIASVPLQYPAPANIQAILDRLHKMERGCLATMLNDLVAGNEAKTIEFQWGECVGYANALFFTGQIDCYQQKDLCVHAKELKSQRCKPAANPSSAGFTGVKEISSLSTSAEVNDALGQGWELLAINQEGDGRMLYTLGRRG
ncbi:hypothetical protein PSTH68_04405 [Pseudomonas syringae pv. theae]|uniref:hypothetical protein n=1 Tax=Pseudomonas syringae TaxID=317 RepID=UPI0005786C5B|nr:hypothetical protein [Pseudomonas syringae]MBL3872695.1 hypothetical protein [Pseudomonas syringae pv. theae]GKQ28722.1 hypothetical protein PSTH68_04405 [Pseudomonas syringae pv. theae]